MQETGAGSQLAAKGDSGLLETLGLDVMGASQSGPDNVEELSMRILAPSIFDDSVALGREASCSCHLGSLMLSS